MQTDNLWRLDLSEYTQQDTFRSELDTVTKLGAGTAYGIMTYLYSFDYLEDDVMLEQYS